ncbi:hypothetical protein [Pseudomonas chlororaphis]|uniref:hypothetical protein n=1 Tax=Pseudomonas chlororaphis TaxID=587753 RepID=UPI0013DDF3EB|nr:hypothetical protein [Pseudomonas chlororaphis]
MITDTGITLENTNHNFDHLKDQLKKREFSYHCGWPKAASAWRAKTVCDCQWRLGNQDR